MSDFDKEAEREKLREKYEKDQQRRETTEKMSELLLQGATMTNNHCADCSDPIFRYDGQEFCPTCERPVDSSGEEQDAADGSNDGQETIGVTEPRDDARVKFGGDADEPQSDAASESTDHSRRPVDQQSRDTQQARNNQTAEQTQHKPGTARSQQPPRDQQRRAEQPQSIPSSDPDRSAASSPAGTADVTAARESLVRTLAKFSQQAEATDDPQRAQQSLAAAREAAEALAALRR